MKRYILKLAIIILLMGIVITPTACKREGVEGYSW